MMKILALALCLAASSAAAQETCPCPPPPPPEPSWKGSLGGGLALTGGNSDTNSYNLSFNVVYDPKTKNTFKADGSYLRSDTDDRTTANSSSLSVRDEYRFAKRAFFFGEARYYRDEFKDIEYLISPLAGIGVNVVDTEKVQLSVDLAAGGQFEKDEGRESTSDGAVSASQRFGAKLSPNATLSEKASALWKMNDFGDALYRFEISLAASISKRMEMKLTFRDDYKTRPPNPLLKKNDTAVMAAIVFKIA
jgi:putative salt-induced outer membrane protein YdiY